MVLELTPVKEYQAIDIVLAHCRDCRGRARVLPAEVLPYKRYSLRLFEKHCRLYLDSNPAGPGLRKTVTGPWDVYGHPHYTTLHRWTAALGERVLDRLPTRPPASHGPASRPSHHIPRLPTSALVAQSAKRLGRGVKREWNRPVKIPAWKYKSPRRREQLQACARLLSTAALLFPDDPSPLTAWESWSIEYLNVAGWWFSSSYSDTTMQHPAVRPSGVRYPATLKPREKEANNGPRAPPDGVFSV